MNRVIAALRPTRFELAVVVVALVLAALGTALAPRRVDLVVVNARSAPSRFKVGAESVFLGPGASVVVSAPTTVRLARGDVQGGAFDEERSRSLTAPLFGPRPAYVWRSGADPCWVVTRGFGALKDATYPPQPIESADPVFLLPGDFLPGANPAFPKALRVSKREAQQGTERRGLFTDAVVRRLRAQKALPAEDGAAVAPASAGALRARQGLELLLAALLGAALGSAGVAAARTWRRVQAARGERRVPSVVVLAGTFGLLVLAILPLGRFASWVPAGDAKGFSYSVLEFEPHDEGGHVAYLPSLLLDRDVDLYNQDERTYYLRTQLTPTGRALEYWTLGTPLVWFPFHAAAHLGVQAARVVGVEVAADGTSAPYVVALGLASATCLLLGGLCCLGLGRRFGAERPAQVAALLIAFSTPLVFYGLVRSRMDHAAEFFAVAAAAWAWFALRGRSRGRIADLGLGLLWGIAITTRQSNVVLLAGPTLDAAVTAWRVRAEPAARSAFLRRAGWVGLGLGLPCLLHLILLTTLWGVPYSLGQQGMLGWPPSLITKLGKIWFGNWGIAIMSPVWVVGLIGLIAMIARPREGESDRWLATLCLVQLAAALGIAVLLPEWRLSSYGWRHLLAVQVFLVPGVVWMVRPVSARAHWLAGVGVAALIVWQCLLMAQYPVLIDDRTSTFTQDAIANLPQVVTSDRWIRSTNAPRVLYRAATVDAPVPASDLVWIAGILALFVLVPAWLGTRLDRWARSRRRADGIGRPLQTGVVASAALLALLALTLLPGVPGLSERDRATRALASARRHVVDPLDALSTFARLDRVEAFLTEARRLAPNHPELARTEAVVAARYGDARAALRRLRVELRARPDDPELRSAVVLALRRTGQADQRALRAPLEAAVQVDPRNLRDRLDLIELLIAAGDRGRALDLLAEARGLARRLPVARRLDALEARAKSLQDVPVQPSLDPALPPSQPADDPRRGGTVRWVAGDVHLHSESAGASPRSLATEALTQELRGQGLEVGAVLAWGLRPESTQRLVPGPTAQIVVGAEVSDFGNGYPDHVLMLGGEQPLAFPRRLYALPIVRWARKRGALVGVAHANHWSGNPGRYPPRTTQSPFEFPACVALGEELFLCTEVLKSQGFRVLWYGLLNCGFRVPLAGGSDWPVAGQHAGETRTYVPVPRGAPVKAAWLDGIRRGRTVVATGRSQFALLRVGSALPGAVVHRPEPGAIDVDVLTAFERPGWIEVVVNGRTAERIRVPAGATQRRRRIDLRDSGWVALRGAAVHTGAVTVEVGGRPVRASARAARYFLRYVDTLEAAIRAKTFVQAEGHTADVVEAERKAALADYGRARAVFAAIAAEAEARAR